MNVSADVACFHLTEVLGASIYIALWTRLRTERRDNTSLNYFDLIFHLSIKSDNLMDQSTEKSRSRSLTPLNRDALVGGDDFEKTARCEYTPILY